jgi:hypothetical protein
VFEGTYKEFLSEREKRAQNASQSNGKTASGGGKSPAEPASNRKKHGLNPHQLKLRIVAVEDQIQVLEGKLETVLDALNAATVAGDGDQVRTLNETYMQTQTELDSTMAEWELLME